MIIDGQLFLRASGRITDGRKVACLVPVSTDAVVFENDEPVDFVAEIKPILVRNIHRWFGRLTLEKVKISRLVIAEQMDVSFVLTEKDLQDEPEWQAAGYKVGDKASDWITMQSWTLDKDLFE